MRAPSFAHLTGWFQPKPGIKYDLPIAFRWAQVIAVAHARALVAAYVRQLPSGIPPDDEVLILEEATIERSWGGRFSIPCANGAKPKSCGMLLPEMPRLLLEGIPES